MSFENFIMFMQQLLTMVDEHNMCSVEQGRSALNSVVGLARASGKVDVLTHRVMLMAIDRYDYLIGNREDFIGKPGDYTNNQNKRNRLANVLQPGC